MSKKIGTMNLILALVGVTLLAYTVTVLVMSAHRITVPSELTVVVFGACTGECGAMAWIKNTKERHEDRKWMKEDNEGGYRNE